MSSRMSTAVCTAGARQGGGHRLRPRRDLHRGARHHGRELGRILRRQQDRLRHRHQPDEGSAHQLRGRPERVSPRTHVLHGGPDRRLARRPRLVYFGYDASNLTAQNCASPCRTELANGYAKLFESSCTVGNSCTQLKHAFRRNDESGTTDVFVKALGVPAINQKDNFSPFCNNGTTGPAINAVTLPSCTANADCNPGGTAGGTCDTNAANRTFDKCTKLGCSASTPCPAAPPARPPASATWRRTPARRRRF